jgi:hypothetical protein
MKLRQEIAVSAVRLVQELGPHRVRVLGKTYAEPDRVLEIATNLGWENTLIAITRILFETLLIYKMVLSRA